MAASETADTGIRLANNATGILYGLSFHLYNELSIVTSTLEVK